jgi:hypothetical protein
MNIVIDLLFDFSIIINIPTALMWHPSLNILLFNTGTCELVTVTTISELNNALILLYQRNSVVFMKIIKIYTFLTLQ